MTMKQTRIFLIAVKFCLVACVLLLQHVTPAWSQTGPQAVLNFPRVLTAEERGFTGLALLNPSPNAATVTATLFDGAGNLVSSSTQRISGGSQFSRLASQ